MTEIKPFTQTFYVPDAHGKLIRKDVNYVHEEKPGYIKLQYVWLHLPTGKSGIKDIWVNTLEGFFLLIEGWKHAMELIWSYAAYKTV